MNAPTGPYRLVVVSGGTSDPSSTRMLAERLAERVVRLAAKRRNTAEPGPRTEADGGADAKLATVARDGSVRVDVIDLRELATEITAAVTSQLLGPGLESAVELLAEADGLVAAAPVYKAGASGLFTSFFQVLDNDLLIGKPVLLASTAGTARHALVIDGEMRSLFAYLRALSAPTSVFAASEDWNAPELGERIDRAAFELLLLMESGFASAIREGSWQRYQHEYGSATDGGLDIDLSSDLMRLATGGSAS